MFAKSHNWYLQQHSCATSLATSTWLAAQGHTCWNILRQTVLGPSASSFGRRALSNPRPSSASFPACRSNSLGTRRNATAASALETASVEDVPSAELRQPATHTSSSSAEGSHAAKAKKPAEKSTQARQTLDYTTLAACVWELKQRLIPAKIEQVVQSGKEVLSLRLRTLEHAGWLHLSWQQASARLATGPPPQRGTAAEAFSFGSQLHGQLRGLVLQDALLPQAWERVAELRFGARPDEPPTHSVFLEIMGRYSNVVLTDAQGTILAAAYQVGKQMSSLRQVQTGGTYQLPPPAPGLPPSELEQLAEWRANATRAAEHLAAQRGRPASLLDGLVRAYQAVGPSLAQELCETAGVPAATTPAELDDQQWAAVHVAWLNWLRILRTGTFSAGICLDSGRYSVLGAYPPLEGVHAMIDTFYSDLQGTDTAQALHGQLTGVVRRAVKKVAARAEAFHKQLGAGGAAEATQKLADLIMANAYRYTPGADSLEVEDWETGEPLSIPLDPTKTAVEAAEELYKKARKQRRASGSILPLLAAAESEAEYLAEVESSLQQLADFREDAENLAALQGIQEELIAGRYMKPPPEAALAAKGAAKGRRAQQKANKPGTGAASPTGFRQYTSPGGFKVLVGRNNKQNDELTHRVATDGDVWLHARGCPGSHTVLRVPAGRIPSDEDVQFAADLAAFFSKAREEGKAPVVRAALRDIRKPKGAPPGKVMVLREQVLLARPARSAAAQERQAEGDES